MSEHCAATVDRHATKCNSCPAPGMEWCPRHNEERIKLYLNYKRWHVALEAGQDMKIGDIKACSSMKTIRDWNERVRSRYGLVDRCIKAREHFTERFFGNDMDFGHRTFWLSLVQQRDELEQILTRLEGRGYDLFLESQNARWVRDRQPEHPSHSDCFDHVENHEPKVNGTEPTTLSNETEAQTLRAQIKWAIATYMLPATSRYYEERKRVVWAYICRVIYTDPALMLATFGYADVPSFTEADHDVSTLRKIEQQLRCIMAFEVRAAIDDVLRPVDEQTEHVTVLGVRLYKAQSGIHFPLHAWGHLFAFRLCPGCNRALCQTVEEMIESSRYALFTGSAPFRCTRRVQPKIDDLPVAKILAICGLVLEFPDMGKRICITKRSGTDQSTIWEEDKNTPLLCAALSGADPRSHTFLNELLRYCISHTKLAVMLRKGNAEPVIRSAKTIISQFQRTAESLAGLTKQSWVATRLFTDALLEAAHWQPCARFLRRTVVAFDCMQFAVLDNAQGHGDERFLTTELLDIWKAVYKAETVLDLCSMIAAPYIADGEFEMDPVKGGRSFLPNCEERCVAHKALWGTAPEWMGDTKSVDYPTVWHLAEEMSNVCSNSQ
ncbi:hypothetical protein DFH07DRAFT_804709 [Mycena maculata]|uniref:Uncharacterized protein n=1 Tax=Mycena maculata TaxID=230809 RepID=A0AAD7JWU1_9AGAR|nr:hypothetical protein DFH07DRAFT_804709 [Mycena maculata]